MTERVRSWSYWREYRADFWGEEVESRVTEKLSLEFSRTQSRNLGALSKLDDFFLRKPKLSPRPFRKHPGKATWKTGNQLGILSSVMLTRNWTTVPAAPTIQLHLTRTRPPTWWQEFKKRLPIAPMRSLKDSKRRRAPQVSHHSAMRTPRVNWNWPIFVDPSAVGQQQQFRQLQKHRWQKLKTAQIPH